MTRKWARVLLVIHLMLGITGYACIWWITDSVCVTGPAVVVIALVMAVAGAASSRWLMAILGVMTLAFAALLVVLVNFLHWGPGAARIPFLYMGAGYLLVQVPLTVWVFILTSADFAKWCCQACGYPLFGLTTKACPECGAEFDPEHVKRHTPEEALRGR